MYHHEIDIEDLSQGEERANLTLHRQSVIEGIYIKKTLFKCLVF